jgi:separase
LLSFRRLVSCPASFLWGCSSGKLHRQGVHDPSGTVLSYLISGAPFVIGNLWDVTDVDIDKLSMRCMDDVLSPTETETETAAGAEAETGAGAAAGGGGRGSADVPSALVAARAACKLKCAVGFAPVMYGVPTRIIL